MFITFEGPEGAGKTTQIVRVQQFLTERNTPCILVREPGGTPIGDRIRQLVLDPERKEMAQQTEILLYAASRAQLVDQVIRPALASGKIVLCDRYVDSSLAYQSYGAMWDLAEVKQVNHMATGGLRPDRTYLLDITVERGQERIDFRGNKKDRIELKEKMFHNRVRDGYLQLAQAEPERFLVINAAGDVNDISQRIIEDLATLLYKVHTHGSG